MNPDVAGSATCTLNSPAFATAADTRRRSGSDPVARVVERAGRGGGNPCPDPDFNRFPLPPQGSWRDEQFQASGGRGGALFTSRTGGRVIVSRLTFEIPDDLAEVAFEHVNDLAYVRDLRVVEGNTDFRLSETRCACGRQLREKRWGPVGTWISYCRAHDSEGAA